MENNFLQIAASVGHAVAYTIGPIFRRIKCATVFHQWLHEYWPLKRQLSLSSGLTLIFDGTPQVTVQRCKIAAPRWPNHISFPADNAIFKTSAQNIEYSFG